MSASAAASHPATLPAGQVCTTPGPGRWSSPAVATSTIPHDRPVTPSCAASAALKVASPQRVGGCALEFI
ncbi:hypothetical protein [Dactylosporangium sp. NPDC049140]|uniref:hypothetical protein n=1 Tax=Dactylosporangium sp. NPDC049140 TaxID=3155647 RepID=UPI0033FAB2BB